MSVHRPEKVRAWRALVEAWKQSGQTVNAFCRARQITRSNFDRWRRILAAESIKSSPSTTPLADAAGSNHAPHLSLTVILPFGAAFLLHGERRGQLRLAAALFRRPPPPADHGFSEMRGKTRDVRRVRSPRGRLPAMTDALPESSR